jgi:hypothetical protein
MLLGVSLGRRPHSHAVTRGFVKDLPHTLSRDAESVADRLQRAEVGVQLANTARPLDGGFYD